MERKSIPIGLTDYREFFEKNCYYVDKTLLIKDLLGDTGVQRKVTLIPRPRRFGKTLNMSMLKYFFERTEQSHAYLFEDKKIWGEKERKHQGQYPVIFLSLKGLHAQHWKGAYQAFKELISEEYSRHQKKVASVSTADEQKKFKAIISRTADVGAFKGSLKFLSKLLARAYQQNVIILIDEYDSPIVAGYGAGYYEDAVSFLRAFLTTALKDNDFLEKAFVTGISRIAKESIFSELNNPFILGQFEEVASDKFGFTQAEIDELFAYYNMSHKIEEYRRWYDGYRFGSHANMYNPWSVLYCMTSRNEFRPYWGTTSSNNLIKRLVLRSDARLKQKLEELLEGQSFVQPVHEGIIYPGIERDSDAIWSLLLYAGYVTFSEHQLSETGRDLCRLVIPNQEMLSVYQAVVIDAMKMIVSSHDNTLLAHSLTHGDVKLFSELLSKFLLESMSHFDENYRSPENGYHMLMLGLTHGLLRETYRAKSNPESGYGRADLMLIPNDTTKPGIVIEFKKSEKGKNIEHIANQALQQIKDKKYDQEIYSHGCTTIFAYAMVFEGKKVLIKMIHLKA